MPEEPASSARLRHIGRTLRNLREGEGKTLGAVRRRLDRSPASLSAIENGLQPLRPRDLKYILEEYRVTDLDREGLLELAEQERQPGWWLDFKDIASPSDFDYASLEWSASTLDAFEMSFVPGLLQTEDYARAVIQSDLTEIEPAKADRFVGFRMARQQILDRPTPPQLRVILDEAALRRARGGPAVMRAQLHRLLDESSRDHITMQVLPFSCTADPGISETAWMLDIGQPAILSVVLITHLTRRWMLEGEADTARYREAFDRVRAVALSETDSRTLINQIVSEL